jgi:alkylresorcinol/alkylpyrone synthase
MNIAAVASAFPQYYYPQAILLTALQEYWKESVPNARVLAQLHAHAGVEGRFLVRPIEEYYNLTTFGQSNDVFIEAAQELGEQAICHALKRSGFDRSQIGAIFFVSVTGVASPSIDARLINRMKLPSHVKRTPIFGLGCVAGAAGIARAADYVRAFPDQIALLLSVELCSLTLQKDDLTMANLISSGLFGDGAAAVVIVGSEAKPSGEAAMCGATILDTRSTFYPETEDVMGWDISEKGFRIVLSREVPRVARENLGRDVDAFLAMHGLSRADIGSWVLHTGGPKVLEACADSLGLRNGELQASWDCLKRMGNLSSASVLCVLEEVMTSRRPASGTMGVMAAMGPGFCSEVILLRW